MLALAFSLLVFVYWTVLGRAVISVAYPRVGVLRGWLLSPALGLSIVVLAVMVLNQAGIPIRHFASLTSLLLGVSAVGLLVWRRPVLPSRRIAPFAIAILFAWLWTGWPAFETGFKWISYANDDMANYCLAAQRFMDNGFYAVPTKAELAGRDYASYYYFMHVADMMRFGAEHVVAWTASIGRIKATEAFMPAILALGLVQISAAGALVLHRGRLRRVALLTVWLMAVSPLFMLGTLYQLIAQVGGVALLLTIVALLLRTWGTPSRPTLVRYSVLPAINAAALCVFYPEVTPFAVLTFGGYGFVWVLRFRRFPATLATVATYTLLGVLLLLRHNIISYVSILIVQSGGALNAANLLLSLFPYFMIPTGFSNLFGWMPLAHDFPEPVISLSIVAGMLLVAAILLRAVRDAWRLTPAAFLLLAEFALAMRLFLAANDFGLYKLAMWLQPLLLAGFAGLVLALTRNRARHAFAIIALYAITAAPTAFYYTDASRGLKAGGLTELRLASKLGLHPDLPTDRNAQITSTIENVVAAKFAATETRGHPVVFAARDYFFPTTRWDYDHPGWALKFQPHFDEMAQAEPLIAWRNHTLIANAVLWHTQFSQPILDAPTEFYLSVDGRLSLFNKFDLPANRLNDHGIFVTEPASTVHNRLLFVHSGLGNHYYLGDRRKISFFQQEDDLFAPGRTFNGIGRFMLLRIENPSPKVYVRISATRTLVTGRTAWKPGAKVRGETDFPLGVKGNGAFNLFIGPVTPVEFKGAHYLAIDFAEMPAQLTDYRPGLKSLYNRAVRLDYRQLVGWARDISAISEEEYASLHRPDAVTTFPRDLAQADTLEYSGAYEDGWLSPDATFVLRGTTRGELLRIRGAVPRIDGTSLGNGTLRITINGETPIVVPAAPGDFDWLVPIEKRDPATRVELAFSASAPLPGRDQRPAAAKLRSIGIAEAVLPHTSDYTAPGTERLAAAGIDSDGWMSRDASVLLPASERAMDVAVQFEYPGWAQEQHGGVRGRVGDIAVSVPLIPGQRPTMNLRLAPSATPRALELDAPAEFVLPAPDSRRRSLRVLSVRLTEVPPA